MATNAQKKQQQTHTSTPSTNALKVFCLYPFDVQFFFYFFLIRSIWRFAKKQKKTNVNYSNTQGFFIVHIHTMFSIGMKTKWEKMMWLNVDISTKWKWIASIIKNRSHRARQHTCKKSYEICMQKDRCHKTFPSIFRQKERETFSFSLSVVRKKRIKLTTDLNCYVRGR